MDSNNTRRWNVYSIRRRPGLEKPYWFKLGVAFVNGDGSVNLYLDAMPLDGKPQMREWREEGVASPSSVNGGADQEEMGLVAG
jgi:hypothetical protein